MGVGSTVHSVGQGVNYLAFCVLQASAWENALGRVGDGLDIHVLACEWRMERVYPWAPCSVQRTLGPRSFSFVSEEKLLAPSARRRFPCCVPGR